MRAVVRRRYGGPERLEVADVHEPVPGAGEVVVRVATSAVNAADAFMLRGEPRIARAAFGIGRPSQPVLGRDIAGTVTAVGEGVTDLALGDRIHGESDAAWAEFAVLPAQAAARIPRGIDLVQAAALPLPGVTAMQALRMGLAGAAASDRDLTPLDGRKVLVTGASGNVGLLAVAIAAAHGARVTGTASTARLGLVQQAGAEHVADRLHPGVDYGVGFDLIVDLTGHRTLADLMTRLAPRGTLVSSTGAGGRTLGPLPRIAAVGARDLATRRHLRVLAARRDGADLAALGRLVRDGRVTPIIDGVMPMSAAADAVRRFEAGQAHGRIILDATRLG
ncbi:NADP-dependent oxidoreductase [Agromyces intestinalis]|uniref:NADP-dependent oxidoreductase n=1 Tax=Agromyces intestinalis TaxID=2592652 RepID=A0A5C1YJU7_9MICO|nr:NADP-dependent oxidoreductase [Agromyces intestinalis]QEO15387.1 NADP-dependent oxidoreductase [Agromyces intestinalis]